MSHLPAIRPPTGLCVCSAAAWQGRLKFWRWRFAGEYARLYTREGNAVVQGSIAGRRRHNRSPCQKQGRHSGENTITRTPCLRPA